MIFWGEKMQNRKQSRRAVEKAKRLENLRRKEESTGAVTIYHYLYLGQRVGTIPLGIYSYVEDDDL